MGVGGKRTSKSIRSKRGFVNFVKQLLNADKGEAVKKSETFVEVVCVWSLDPPTRVSRSTHPHSTTDNGFKSVDSRLVLDV